MQHTDTIRELARVPVRVRYIECDAQGYVFNAHYLAFADVAFTEAGRALFGGWQQVVDGGADVVVAEANVRYLAPARFDDELEIVVSCERFGTTSMVLRFDSYVRGQLINQVTTRYVWVDAATLRPTPPTPQIKAAFCPAGAEDRRDFSS